MKIERKVKGILARPHRAEICEKNLSVIIRTDNLGDSLTIYDGENMYTIKIEDIGDVIKVNDEIKVNRAGLIKINKPPQENPKENTDINVRTYRVTRVN